MIALPFHPSNAYTIREFKENAYEILKKVEEEGGDCSAARASSE